MTPEHWCANCEAVRELNIHGRCGCCGSEAVCLAAPPRREREGPERRGSLRTNSLLPMVDRVLERRMPARSMARAALELHRVRKVPGTKYQVPNSREVKA